jgi:hypothetical protein
MKKNKVFLFLKNLIFIFLEQLHNYNKSDSVAIIFVENVVDVLKDAAHRNLIEIAVRLPAVISVYPQIYFCKT